MKERRGQAPSLLNRCWLNCAVRAVLHFLLTASCSLLTIPPRCRSPACRLPLGALEPDCRSGHDLQPIVSAVIEENLVSDLGTDAKRSGKELNAASRIEHTLGIGIFR